jgi:SREBP regulating gene protein
VLRERPPPRPAVCVAWDLTDDCSVSLCVLLPSHTPPRAAGYVCRTQDVAYADARAIASHSGCCDAEANATRRYTCANCDRDSSCCSAYEVCVSCCMAADGRRQAGASPQATVPGALASKPDPFALCSVACRTNSRSVAHENAYKHTWHHCFGGVPAPTAPIGVDAGGGSVRSGLFDFVRPLPLGKHVGRRALSRGDAVIDESI